MGKLLKSHFGIMYEEDQLLSKQIMKFRQLPTKVKGKPDIYSPVFAKM